MAEKVRGLGLRLERLNHGKGGWFLVASVGVLHAKLTSRIPAQCFVQLCWGQEKRTLGFETLNPKPGCPTSRF